MVTERLHYMNCAFICFLVSFQWLDDRSSQQGIWFSTAKESLDLKKSTREINLLGVFISACFSVIVFFLTCL